MTFEDMHEPWIKRIASLEAENAALKAQVARLHTLDEIEKALNGELPPMYSVEGGMRKDAIKRILARLAAKEKP